MIRNYIKNPVSFLLVVASIFLVGVFSITLLPIKMYPNMIKPTFRVNFWHQDVGLPEELYKNYGREFEDQIKNLKGLESYQHTYSHNWGNFRLDFEWDIDEEEIKEKLESIFLPKKTGSNNKFGYGIGSSTSQSSGNMMIAVGHEKLSTEELRSLLENQLRNKLTKIENVSNVHFWGWVYNQKALEIDRNKLLSFKLDINQILAKIRHSYQNQMAGFIGKSWHGREKIQVSIPPDATNIDDILDIVLIFDLKKKIIVKVKDIGTITEISKQSDSIYRLNGNNANYLNVVLKPEGDVKKTCDLVEQTLKDFQKQHSGTLFNIIVNPSIFINNAITNLLINASIGGIVAVLIILFFLGSFRNTLIIAASIPFCIISSFILMNIFGVTINIISLGGMAIGVGMIVDSSIVCLENIHRKLSTIDSNQDKISAIFAATKEVGLPVFSSILTSIVVFFPIIFTKSYTKAILGDLAKTVIFTLSVSIVTALIIIPFVSYRFMSFKTPNWLGKLNFFKVVPRWYENILLFLTKNKKRAFLSIFVALILFVSSIFVIPYIKREIIAIPTTKLLDINFSLMDNNDVSLANKYVTKVEKFLKNRTEIKSYATYLWNPNHGYITAEMAERHQYEKLKEMIEDKFPITPEAKIIPMNWDPGKMPLPRKIDLKINFSGSSDSELTNFSDQVMALSAKYKVSMWRRPWMSKNEGVTVKFHPWVENNTINSIRSYLEASSGKGIHITEVFENGKNYYMQAIFQEEQRMDYIETLRSLPILYQEKIIPLKAIAEVKMLNESYVPIHFSDGVRIQQVSANFKTKDESQKKKLIKQMKKDIEKVEKPIDLNIDYVDTNKEINKSFESFKLSLIISVGLVFLIISILFNSIKYPLIILATVPFAITGVVGGLYLCGSTLSLNSMLGTILLSGLVVNNAILFIDFYRESKQHSQNTIMAIQNAAALRFRPIIMTTLTTLLGVMPIALAFGESGEILQPLGISVFFGLLISTALTLFIIPCFLRIID